MCCCGRCATGATASWPRTAPAPGAGCGHPPSLILPAVPPCPGRHPHCLMRRRRRRCRPHHRQCCPSSASASSPWHAAAATAAGASCCCCMHTQQQEKYPIGMGCVIKLCNGLVMRLTLARAGIGCCWVLAWRQLPCGCRRLPLAGSGRRQPPRSCVMEQKLHSGSSCCGRGGWKGSSSRDRNTTARKGPNCFRKR